MPNKYVIYTVITGGFDELKQPAVIDGRFDYVCFTDNDNGNIRKDDGVWQVRFFDFQTANPRLKSRYPKVFPDKLLPGYDASLYIDGNIQITSQKVYDRCIELLGQGVEWGGSKTPGT